MRKLFSIFAALTLSVGLWAETVNVSYLYPEYNDGGFTKGIKEWKTTTVDATVVTTSTSFVYWTAGWYVVNGNVTLSKGAICNDGAVHLILANGATLTATGENDEEEEINSPGIAVTTSASLTIYGQSTNSEEMGTLNATGGYRCAGIGSGSYDFSSPLHDEGDCGNITINGGKIIANGGNNSNAAIGAYSYLIGNITINGGVVTANSNNKSFAGIGGSDAETIVINGGTITATNGNVGIGGEIANLIINDGTVTATSSVVGIGGTSKAEDITINGGAITATGTGTNGIGIGAKESINYLAPFNITINGGTVTANGGNAGVGIGDQWESCYSPYGANIVINGGTVTATSGAEGDAIGGKKHDGIYISDAYVLYAGTDKDNTTVIPHSSAQNLGGTLTQQYAKIQGLATPYTRSMTIDNWATVCLPYEATGFSGAKFYRVNFYDGDTKLYIEEVSSLVAGQPYIFQATDETVTIEHAGVATLTYGEEQKDRGLQGLFARTIIATNGSHAALSNNAVQWLESDLEITVPACRAYFDMNNVPREEQSHSSAPLRCIRVPRQTPTDFENVTLDEDATKILRNGQLIIIRDGKEYNAQGMQL